MTMNTQYFCKQARRRSLVLAQTPPALNGIDYLEVAHGDQTTLLVHFLFPLPGQGIAPLARVGARQELGPVGLRFRANQNSRSDVRL